jgi:hypothetical protein
MSKDHEHYQRPEITRTFETLAKDQREIIEEQKKRNEIKLNLTNLDFFGFINSKIYSYVELSTDICFKRCDNKNNQKNENREVLLNNSEFSFNLGYTPKTDLIRDGINYKCFDNCMNKKIESFRMLINVRNYFII